MIVGSLSVLLFSRAFMQPLQMIADLALSDRLI
jgi:hypothetical protein